MVLVWCWIVQDEDLKSKKSGQFSEDYRRFFVFIIMYKSQTRRGGGRRCQCYEDEVVKIYLLFIVCADYNCLCKPDNIQNLNIINQQSES
jgi:hypothetical protein